MAKNIVTVDERWKILYDAIKRSVPDDCSVRYFEKLGHEQKFRVVVINRTNQESFEWNVYYSMVRTKPTAYCLVRFENEFNQWYTSKEKETDDMNDWSGFRETRYNWAIFVIEHWVDHFHPSNTNNTAIDGSKENFLRIYCTRERDFRVVVESLTDYLKRGYLCTSNWFEIVVKKGNSKGNVVYRAVLKPEQKNNGEEER